jgi:hypothetical protein
MSATLKPILNPQTSHILSLPFEIIQHIATYLDNASAATFSLSNRHIRYAIGTQYLSRYITASPSRFEARERLEKTIERALPGAWHCAWCDEFHTWSATDGPTSAPQEPLRPCAEYNSYLSDGLGYILRYHHIRLALSHHLYGPGHGIPLRAFEYSSHGSVKLFKTPVQTWISHEAKIAQGSFLLHTNYSILLPTRAAEHKNLIGNLWPLLPAALIQHRASEYGHRGLMAALDNTVRRGWRYPGTQTCSDCATDYILSTHNIPRSIAGEFVRLNIQTWRLLGEAKSPFDTTWRAHGPFLSGTEESCVREEVDREAGGIRLAFEDPGSLDSGRDRDEACSSPEWEQLAYSWQLEKKQQQEEDQESEWRAIWRYVERRAGVERGRVC